MIFSKLTNAHVSHESCSIFYYYDMTEIYGMGNQIKLALENLSNDCDKSMDSNCKVEWNLLREQYQYTKQNLGRIHPKNRSRRFTVCEWCGKIEHSLYGTVDADEARENFSLLCAVKQVTRTMDAAVREKVLNDTITSLQSQLGEMQSQNLLLNKRIDELLKQNGDLNSKLDQFLKNQTLIGNSINKSTTLSRNNKRTATTYKTIKWKKENLSHQFRGKLFWFLQQ